MKVWFTRPSTWDLYVRGVDRCELWLQKPVYVTEPRGKDADPLLPGCPTGWRVVDPLYGDITGQVCVSVRDIMPPGRFDPVTHVLWDALCRSVDGKGPEEDGIAPRRWLERLEQGSTLEEEWAAMSRFLFEYDASPDLWFAAAMLNGLEQQTAAGRWAQKYFPLDDELGLDDAGPVHVPNAVIQYAGADVSVF